MRSKLELEAKLAELNELVAATKTKGGGGFEQNQQLIAACSMLRWVLGKGSPEFDRVMERTTELLKLARYVAARASKPGSL